MNLRKNFKCLNCEKETDIEGLFKIKYKEIIRGWFFDHYDEKEAWDITKQNEHKKSSMQDSKILFKKPKKEDIGLKNELLSKKTHLFKKNTQSIYKSLFNELERENSYSTANFFQNDFKQENGTQNLIQIDKNYPIPPLIKKLQPHLKEKEFKVLLKNPGFLEKAALVCENCFLLIIGSSNAHESLKQITKKHTFKNFHFYGQGKLNPERLNHRYNVT